MEQKFVEELLKEISDVCPAEFDVVIKPTKRSFYLVIIKDKTKVGDVDDWSINRVYPLRRELYSVFCKFDEGLIRDIYLSGHKFVLYSPLGGALRKFNTPLQYEVYGDYAWRHYVGECENIEKLIAFLAETPC